MTSKPHSSLSSVRRAPSTSSADIMMMMLVTCVEEAGKCQDLPVLSRPVPVSPSRTELKLTTNLKLSPLPNAVRCVA